MELLPATSDCSHRVSRQRTHLLLTMDSPVLSSTGWRPSPSRDRPESAPQMLTAPGERRRVGGREVEAHHVEQGVQEPFGLALREIFEEPHGSGQVSMASIRVPPKPTPPAAHGWSFRLRPLPRTATPSHGVVARIVTGPEDGDRQDPHLPMRYDHGRPRAVIRFKIAQPRTASLACPAGDEARRPSPMMDLYRKNAFSTRLWRWYPGGFFHRRRPNCFTNVIVRSRAGDRLGSMPRDARRLG